MAVDPTRSSRGTAEPAGVGDALAGGRAQSGSGDTAPAGADGPRRALITGISGQDGSYLAELLLEKGYRVTGLAHARPPSREGEPAAAKSSAAADAQVDATPAAPLGAAAHLQGRIDVVAGELLDHASIAAALRQARPHELYHLAGPSFVPYSWEHPSQTFAAIAGATAALLEAVRAIDPAIRVFAAGSAAMFGWATESPQREDTHAQPNSPYAVAKLATHQLVGALRAHDGLYVCSGILYSHESERRPLHFATRKITRAAAAIKLGQAHEVVLGDLDAVRDWSFAGDIVRGAWQTLQQERPADYVLASGVPHTIAQFADAAFACVGLRAADYIRVDPALVRAREAAPPVGDPTRAHVELGWRAELDFEALVERMVRADLHALGGAAR